MSIHKNDLISKLGKQPDGDASSKTQESVKVEPDQNIEQPNKTAATEVMVKGEETATSGKDSDDVVKEPDSWSKESALKEVTKLREENKAQRLKYTEKLEEIKQDLVAQNEPLKQQLDELQKYKDELDSLKASEEDKKRSLEDKIFHRESRIAELEASNKILQAEKEKELQSMKERLSMFEAREEAQNELYHKRLRTELDSIPEKFREHAELIAKGAGDANAALVAIHEARLKGLFDDKTVIVNHSVPGAKDGARATQDQLDSAARAERDKMDSRQKIGTALSEIRKGDKNSAFRL